MEASTGILEEDQKCCSEVALQVDYSKDDDHTSNLPEEVISYILSFLTVRDAVKVRVLSSRWRYLCAATFDLHFDPFTVFGVNWDSVCFNSKLWEGRLGFVRAVDQVLKFCNREKLESFWVRYILGNEYASQINSWVIFAVTKRTERLHLDFSHVPESCELYNFPCHSLLQGESSKLKHLTLEASILRPQPDSIKCFNSLTKLELHDMPLDRSDLHNILRGCISLEFLKLKLCRICGGMGTLYIRGQLKLRWLIVEACSGATTIEISSINLMKFEYTGFERTFRFIDVPYLEKVYLHLHWWSHRFLTEVAENFRRIQHLTKVMMVSQRIQRPQVPTTFQHVIKLDLIVFMIRGFDLRSIIFILNAYPCLQKFHLMMQCWNRREEAMKWVYSEQLYHHHLKRVEISGFFDECNLLELAIYLMKNAVGLKQMVINLRKRRYYGGGQWSQSRARTMSRDERKRIHKVVSKEKVDRNLQVIVK